jgi:DNA-binding winged helix-turn-helix (wHTH) protein/Tfp pilus assembly protein PilF
MTGPSLTHIVRFGIFEADLASGELRKQGVLIRLREQSFRVLANLLERPGNIVTRDELRARLWPADTFVDFDNGLNAAVNGLRKALADSAESPRFVETLPRRGYRFIAPVSGTITIPELASERDAATLQPQVGRQHLSVNLPRTTMIAALVFSVLLLAGSGRVRKVFSRKAVVSQEAAHAAQEEFSPEAVASYQLGRHYLAHQPDGQEAIDAFTAAIAREPRYASAYAGLADAYVEHGLNGAMPTVDAYARARTAATKALELDDSIPEAHLALGDIKLSCDWDWGGAQHEFERALELDGGNEIARVRLSRWMAYQGQYEESIHQAEEALKLNPLSLHLNVVLGDAFFASRQFERALAVYKHASELEPNSAAAHTRLATVLEELGRYGEMFAEWRRGAMLSGDSPASIRARARAYKMHGYRGWVVAELGPEFRDPAQPQFSSKTSRAEIYAQLGDKEEAFRYLNEALREHDNYLFWLNIRTDFDGLRSDARFGELLSKIGLQPSPPPSAVVAKRQ